MSRKDLTLLTDFYELTMMQGYYKEGQNETVVFDVFFRNNPSDSGYSICAGLAPVSYTHLSLPRNHQNQTFQFQFPDCFPDWRPADSQLVGKLDFHQPFSRL